MADMVAILDIGQNDFSNSNSPSGPNASHQVWTLSDLGFRSRFSRWPPWPSWIAERNDFSYSESLCSSDASHQVLVQSDLQFGRRCCLKNFKMATMATILDFRKE